MQSTDRLIEQKQHDKASLSELFTSMNLIMKLMFDLSVHDLPQQFEDQLPAINSLLLKYLTYENKLLAKADENDAGLLEHVKAGIFEVLELWVQKYEEDFGKYVGPFIESSWNFLTNIGLEVKYDILVSKALQFLTAVIKSVEHAQAFREESTMSQVIERVVLPNMTLRESDMELFEDEPIEFIRRDLEGSDSDTRRRAATDFLRGLLAKFETMVATVVLKYVQHYLSVYSKSPSNSWKSKDTATYLYSSIAAKGTITASQGVTSINEFANVVDFFSKHIADDLLSDAGVHPILKVDAIKYLYIFRSQITPAQWQDAFPLLVKQLGSTDYVVYTYAAIALERTMALNNSSKQSIISRLAVEKLAPQLLQHLFGLIESDVKPAKLQENEFLMRCIMRVLIVIKEGVVSITDEILPHLTKIIGISGQNPSNPRFCYYLFEATGAFVRYVLALNVTYTVEILTISRFAAPAQSEKLESEFYGTLATILQNDIQGMLTFPNNCLFAKLTMK